MTLWFADLIEKHQRHGALIDTTADFKLMMYTLGSRTLAAKASQLKAVECQVANRSNILLLLLVDSFERGLVSTFKRTQQFTEDDFDLLVRFLGYFRILVTTPKGAPDRGRSLLCL